jgi:hypothetical protein
MMMELLTHDIKHDFRDTTVGVQFDDLQPVIGAE